MPPCCWRSRPAPCPSRLGGRRPRRRLFLPPPPEGCPGPTIMCLSSFAIYLAIYVRSARRDNFGIVVVVFLSALSEWCLASHIRTKPAAKLNPAGTHSRNDLLSVFGAWSLVGAEGQPGSMAVG